MTLTYVVAVLAGIGIGIWHISWWSLFFIPFFTAFFLLFAYFLNIWVEHRYITYPFERTAQDTITANKQLIKEIESLRILNTERIPERSYNHLIMKTLRYIDDVDHVPASDLRDLILEGINEIKAFQEKLRQKRRV
jgi:hypothetical protein